jgi:exosortase
MNSTATKSTANSSAQQWIDGLFAIALLAHLPLAYEYCRRMWLAGHYQFFPLLLAAVGWMLLERLLNRPLDPAKPGLNHWLLAGNAFLLALAVLIYSPFLWIISLLALIVTYIYDRWGAAGVVHTAPVWLLLLFAVPLPMNLDLKLVNKLQFLSSQLASYILDAFGQGHFREGVILITEKKQFFTEEACSGIRSLFSSLAAISIFGVMNRYGWPRHVFNLCQTVLWVIIGNAVRIALVVYLADNVDESFASGTTHEMLGLVNFVFVFLCALSTDRGINAWQASTVDVSRTALESDVEEPTLEGVVVAGGTNNAARSAATRPPIWRWSLSVAFAIIALFAVRLAYAKISEDDMRFGDEDLAVSFEDDLPAQIAGWQKISFDHQLRDDTRLLAPESYVWTYCKEDGRRVIISVDSPYYDFHNLNDCYEGFGWDVEYANNYPGNGGDLTTLTNLSKLTMEKSSEHGLVMFTAFDRNGVLVRPTFELNYDPTGIMLIGRHLRLALGLLDQSNDPRFSKQAMPISQVQLLHVSNQPNIDTSDIDQFFVEARLRLQDSPRFKNRN